MWQKLAALLLCLALCATPATGEAGAVGYRFADRDEAAALLLGNRGYYENLTRQDLDFRVQKRGATLAELEAFAAAQTLDFTDAEKAAVDGAMAFIEAVCAERGYALPATDGIVFAKTTMAEECGVAAYTHGAQIYLGQALLGCGVADAEKSRRLFRELVAHELFHCLTRNHPDFRAAMYAVLGFTVEDAEYAFAPAVRDAILSNPDVERHDAHAAFEIDGATRECVVVLTAGRPFEQPGDSFRNEMSTGLVPVDDLSTIYASEEAANFWDVFGRNTDYAIDPEEALADNFGYLIVRGPDAPYENPEIIAALDACLKAF